MLSRQITVVGIAVLLLATPAAAQWPRWEIGAFGSYTTFGDLVQLENKYGFGGRLGVFLVGPLELEASSSFTTTQTTALPVDVTYLAPRVSLIYNQRLFGGVSFLLGASYFRNQYTVAGVTSGDNGYGGLLGLRFNLGRRFALRFDGTADYLNDLSDVATSIRDNTNLGLEAGISLTLGGGPGSGSGTSYDDWDDDEGWVDRPEEAARPEPELVAGEPDIDAEHAPAAAFAPGRWPRWELGTFGTYTSFDDQAQLDSKIGFGGRLGYFFMGRLELEGAASVTGTQASAGPVADITYLPIRGSLIYNQPVSGGMSFLLGASYYRNRYSVAGTSSSDNGYGGLLGLRMELGRRFALRVDGTADRSTATGNATNLGLEGGISLMLGGGRGTGHGGWVGDFEDTDVVVPVVAPVGPDMADEEPGAAFAPGRWPRWELGTFGTYTSFDDQAQLDSKIGIGGRLGYFFMGRLELEGAASVTGTQASAGPVADITYLPIRASLIYNQPVSGGISFLLGASYYRNRYTVAGTSSSDNGYGGLLGLRMELGRRFALRVDGTADRSTATGNATNLGLEGGISLMLGGGRGTGHGGWVGDFEDPDVVVVPVVAPVGPDMADEEPGAAFAPGRWPRWELGTFGSYTSFDDQAQLESKIGFGGRLGYFFMGRLELEGAMSVTGTQTSAGPVADITYLPIRASLIYNQPMFGGVSFLLGASYYRDRYSVAGTSSSDNGYGGLLGLRMELGRRFALRVDGTADRSTATGNATNLGLEGGISLMLGGGRGIGDGGWDDFEDTDIVPLPELAAVDSDADGVLDDFDRCPNTPAGTTVDAGGCEPAIVMDVMPVDSDRDGIYDDDDRCPNSPVGAEVGASGCPIFSEEEAERLAEQSVTFMPGKYEVTPEASVVLDDVAQALRAYPSMRVEIGGHADTLGSKRKNLWLSWNRAWAVRLYLTRRGVDRERLVPKGHGSDDPLSDDGSAEGRAANRRVKLRRLN